MEQLKPFSLAHRKAIADLFRPYGGKIRERALNEFRDRRDVIEQSWLRQHAKRVGAVRVAARIVSLKEELRKNEQKLDTSGFNLRSDGNLQLSGAAPREMRNSLTEAIEKQVGTREDVESKCDEAIQKVWLVSTPEDVQAIVSGLFARS